MTVCLSIMASLVAIAAAARSTWSPCGLSMLSSITPVSERAKGNSYRSTAAWFVLGSTLGGATLGTAMAAAAAAAHRLGLSPTGTGTLAVAAALVSAGSDAGVFGFRVPIHRRQVNERWLDRYRPWVYGAGFGWQIGSGLSTYITTAAVYLMVVLGALDGKSGGRPGSGHRLRHPSGARGPPHPPPDHPDRAAGLSSSVRSSGTGDGPAGDSGRSRHRRGGGHLPPVSDRDRGCRNRVRRVARVSRLRQGRRSGSIPGRCRPGHRSVDSVGTGVREAGTPSTGRHPGPRRPRPVTPHRLSGPPGPFARPSYERPSVAVR